MTADLGTALDIIADPGDAAPVDHVALGYEARLLRRKRLQTEGGNSFLVNLSETVSLNGGEAFVLSDGRLIGVIAAPDDLLEVRGADLMRMAWHIGNRHAPCQIEADRLLIQRDRVMADMLRQLGAELREVSEPFTPEGGAYGHGRTMGHSHGHEHGAAHHVHHHSSHTHVEDEDEDKVDEA